jgi:hypothetical protein
MSHERLIGFDEVKKKRSLEDRVSYLERENETLRSEIERLSSLVEDRLSKQVAAHTGVSRAQQRNRDSGRSSKTSKGRPVTCVTVQMDPDKGYVLYGQAGDGSPAICCLRPNIWIDDVYEEGIEATITVPYAANWYKPVPLKCTLVSVGPTSLKISDRDGEQHWVYRAQVGLVSERGEEGADYATSDRLDALERGSDVTLAISPYIAKKLGLIEELADFERELG